MKLVALALVPILSVLMVTGPSLHKDQSQEVEDLSLFSYTLPWSYSSLEEAVWLAVDDVSHIQKYLPPEVDRYQVRIPPIADNTDVYVLVFGKASLEKLIAGDITSEEFVRDHVKFN
ncbi:MAG: hypothetical protein KAU50_01965 [Candidatus Marinimicrobia bacterium]|nr:hypothetical protein [Candidatus Neomarinimicrobiota bacterium]